MSYPPIPEAPKEPVFWRFNTSVKESLEIGLGRRGRPGEKFVTEDRLADIGLIPTPTSSIPSPSGSLGNAAYKNVGLGAGTVAAGDHLHTGVYDPAGTAAAAVSAHEDSVVTVHTLSQILAGADPSSDYETLKDLVNSQLSTGVVGATDLISDAGFGTVDIATANVLIREHDLSTDDLRFFKVPASVSLVLTDVSHNYIYAEYNAGAPQYVATTTKRTDTNTNILIGTVYRDGIVVHINNNSLVRANDNLRRIALRFVETMPFQRVDGGISSETGTRNIAITAGIWWECTNTFTTDAFDSSATDTFVAMYRNGAGSWTEQTAQTQVDNTYYDDGTGTLHALTALHYATRWVYLESDSDVVVVYGRGDHLLESDAETETEPDRPPRIQATGRLIARIIIRQGATSFTSIQNAFESGFEFTSPTIHNALGGLQGGTAGEYYHFTSAQHTDLTDGGQSSLHGHPSTLINVTTIGTPTDVVTAQDAISHSWSAGIVTGMALTNNGDGTVNIASGEVMLRGSADEHASLLSMTAGATTSLALTDNSVNYVYVNYNAGTPIVQASTSVNDFNCLDKCILYTIAREGTTIYWVDARGQNIDHNRKHRRLMLEVEPFRHVAGGCIIGESGTRNITLTAGAFYYGLAKISHNAFDTSGADTFIYYYRDGAGGWTKQTAQTQINNTQWDDGTGVLATLSNNKFGVHWVYLILDNPTVLAVQYGQGDYANMADAEASTVPTPPPAMQGVGVIVGRIIIEKNAAVFSNADSPFLTSFVPSAATQHNGLAGLQGGAVNEYYHLTSAQATDLTDAGDSALHYHATDRDLANASGNLAVSHLNGGTGADATTFWRGDGTWAVPPSVSSDIYAFAAAHG